MLRSLLIRRALFGLLFAGVAAHLGLALFGPGEGPLLDWLYTDLRAGALGLAAWRAVSISVLVHAALVHGSPLAVVLAGAALFTAMARAILMLHQNLALVSSSRRQAMTDKLSELPNRRALVTTWTPPAGAVTTRSLLRPRRLQGLQRRVRSPRRRRAAAPSCPHAGRGRRARLPARRRRVLPAGGPPAARRRPLVTRAVDALSEHGDGFSVSASYGVVVVPDDATDAPCRRRHVRAQARGGSRGQARDLLVRMMAEREPELDDHHRRGRARRGRRPPPRPGRRGARRWSSGPPSCTTSARSPYRTILQTPGPLDELDWAIMRRHTVVGERILAVTDSMRPVARVVRSSHERWDGGGYPDALAGEAIPLGARIVYACDAFDACSTCSRRSCWSRSRNLDTAVSGCRYTGGRWTR